MSASDKLYFTDLLPEYLQILENTGKIAYNIQQKNSDFYRTIRGITRGAQFKYIFEKSKAKNKDMGLDVDPNIAGGRVPDSYILRRSDLRR